MCVKRVNGGYFPAIWRLFFVNLLSFFLVWLPQSSAIIHFYANVYGIFLLNKLEHQTHHFLLIFSSYLKNCAFFVFLNFIKKQHSLEMLRFLLYKKISVDSIQSFFTEWKFFHQHEENREIFCQFLEVSWNLQREFCEPTVSCLLILMFFVRFLIFCTA